MRARRVIVFFMFMWQNFSGAACISPYTPLSIAFKPYRCRLLLGITDTSLYTGIYGLVKGGCAMSRRG